MNVFPIGDLLLRDANTIKAARYVPSLLGCLRSFVQRLIFGKFFTREPVLKKLLGNALKIQDEGWKILNKRWALFFIGLAILNEIVWRTQSEEFWVNFKVWGMLPITFIFTAFQFNIINKYKIDEQEFKINCK